MIDRFFQPLHHLRYSGDSGDRLFVGSWVGTAQMDKLLLLDKELLAREQKGQAKGKDAEEKAQAQADAKVRRGTALRHARAGTH